MRATHTGRRCALALGLSAAALTAACSHNAAFGGSQLNMYSESQEIAMGQQADSEVVLQMGLVDDAALQRYVQDLGSKLAAKSERPNLPWTFRVVDDAAVNAFALPGGFIFVTRGLLAHVENEAQLAGVIGHEIGHVTARHQVSRLSSQQLSNLGLGIASVLSPTVGRYAGLASQGMQLLFLKYSRHDENQADELGVRYMSRGGFDAHQMSSVMTMLDRVSSSEGGGRVPEWLATHPNPGNRRGHVEQLVQGMPADSVGHTVNEDSYLQRLDGLVFGEDPREGFFRGSTFLHPGLRFQLDFPNGWQTANQRQAVGAISPQQDAIVQVSLAQGAANAEAAARTFLSQQGVQAGATTRVSLNGIPAVGAPFTAQTDNGVLRGSVLFVEQAGSVLMLMGYAPQQAWSGRQGAVESAMRTFRPLTDQAVLNAQPMRLDIVRASGNQTVQQLAQQRPAPVGADRIALINQVETTTPLQSGQLLKWVTGQNFAMNR